MKRALSVLLYGSDDKALYRLENGQETQCLSMCFIAFWLISVD